VSEAEIAAVQKKLDLVRDDAMPPQSDPHSAPSTYRQRRCHRTAGIKKRLH